MSANTGTLLPFHVLLVEPAAHDRAALRRSLETGTLSYRITECESLAQAAGALERDADIDLVAVADALPDGSGLDFLRGLLRQPAPPTLILLAQEGCDHLAVPAFRAGVQDFIIKDTARHYLAYLPHALPALIAGARARRRQRETEASLADSQLRLQQIVEGNSVPTFVLDQNHIVTHWNRACATVTGMPAAKMVGTVRHWRAFYPAARPVMADLIIDNARDEDIERFYHDRFRRSTLIDGAYEAEGFFPHMGQDGRWLFFTAAPLRDMQGRLIGAIETLQDVTEQRRAEAALRSSEERYRRLSITDGLTQLFNSRQFHEQLQQEVKRCQRYGAPLSLLVLDIDDFKLFNDAFGHIEGDHVLVKLADVIRSCLRVTDSGYRHGGEEFAVLLPETTLADAQRVAERLRVKFGAVAYSSAAVPHGRPTTVSIGAAQFIEGEDHIGFLRRADNSTYEAKRRGKNCVVAAAMQLV